MAEICVHEALQMMQGLVRSSANELRDVVHPVEDRVAGSVRDLDVFAEKDSMLEKWRLEDCRRFARQSLVKRVRAGQQLRPGRQKRAERKEPDVAAHAL